MDLTDILRAPVQRPGPGEDGGVRWELNPFPLLAGPVGVLV